MLIKLGLIFSLLSGGLLAQSTCANMPFLAASDLNMEYTTYDNKGRICAKVNTKIILVEETKQGTVYYFESKRLPCKGSQTDPQTQTYHIRCYKDTLYTSMKAMLPPGTLDSYKNMQIVSDGTDLRTPGNPKENEELPPGDLTVAVNSNGVKILTIKANTKNRKVEKKESVTTPAGTFECTKISETTEIKIGYITNKTTTNTWLAPGLGMIKQETFDRKGKLEARTELQKKT